MAVNKQQELSEALSACLVARIGADVAPPPGTVVATLAGRPLVANRGTELNLDWVRAARVNTSAVERRAETLTKRRTVKKEWQAAWLLRAISCMDLTTLSGDDKIGRAHV